MSGLGAGFLGNADIAELTAWRRALHRLPELSGEEAATAAQVAEMLRACGAGDVLTGLGGHGVAGIWDGAAEGPTVLLRCELDGLPIEETGAVAHRSEVAGKAHLCGHDGHMAVLAGVARWLGRNRPAKGRAILLFQPAEEDGAGAARVIDDPRFAEIRPDVALALHNMPGLPLGHVALAEGAFNCASRGMKIALEGRTAHASAPETGVSPMLALAGLMPRLTALGRGGEVGDPGFSLVTVTHASLGAPAFGVAPGAAELWVTLRSQRDVGMAALVAAAEAAVAEVAQAEGLAWEVGYHDVFRACENHPEAVALLADAVEGEGVPVAPFPLPMRASEDFGRFADHAPAAMFLLGAGETCPALHNPDYDFPDALIATGARLFAACLQRRLY